MHVELNILVHIYNFFSGSDDTTVQVWDILAKKCIATISGHHSTVTSMVVSEDGGTLLTVGRDKVRPVESFLGQAQDLLVFK